MEGVKKGIDEDGCRGVWELGREDVNDCKQACSPLSLSLHDYCLCYYHNGHRLASCKKRARE